MIARAYTESDFPLVQQWAEARGLVIAPILMGNRGFVIEDENGPCAVAMIYLLFEVPLAIVDNLITRPGLPGRRALIAWRQLWRCITAYLKALRTPDGVNLGYRIVRTYCNARLTGLAKAEGWSAAEHQSKQVYYALP
ncbi:MAG: hypothetical protein U0984_08485 [Prosthecobacter sp.]|nr:hypothetical protein [Prosthecobacter sp.]